MKKSLLALAVMGAFAGVAQAQTSVTIYGSFDGGLRYLTNANAAGDNRLSISSSGTYMANRLGFKGVEDLGGGMNARFNLESGFNSGTGAQADAASFFNRTASVGIGGAWGAIDVGRLYSVSFRTTATYDPFNSKYTGLTPIAIQVSSGNSTATTNFGGTRFNNDIQYTGTFGPVTARAEWALGEVAGSTGTGSAQAVGLTYANGPLSLGAAYTQKKTVALGTVATSASPTFNDKAYTVGGSYSIGELRLIAGYNNEKVATTTVDNTQKTGWLGASYNVSPAVGLTAAWYQTKLSGPAPVGTSGDGKKDMFIVGTTYALSKRTNFYADIDTTKFSGVALTSSLGNERQTGVSVGLNHMF
jgi:predicted porin